MGQSRWDTGLTGSEQTGVALRNRQQDTRAQDEEERRRDQQIGLREDETQRASDERVHEEEHESVEHNGRLAGLSVHDTNVSARGCEEHTWAESQKKCSWDGDLLRSDIWKHVLIYSYIILPGMLSSKPNPVIKRCTRHKFII